MTEPVVSLAKIHSELAWPAPKDVRNPKGAGAGVFATLAKDKIGRALAAFDDARDAVVGILANDPDGANTEPPLAVVVEFKRAPGDKTLRELQRLAWNFSHSPAVVTVEPTLLRVWSCCEAPDPSRSIDAYVVHQIKQSDLAPSDGPLLEHRALQALHWINLASGNFFRQRAVRFNRDGRADQMLLSNLRSIRSKLENEGLTNDDVCHDLLARIIFVQFLFDRKDSDGNAALSPSKLARLYSDGILKRSHQTLASVLEDFDETYRLFDWLNARFNGDLFPGKGDTAEARARGWAAEKRVVRKKHLAMLADFINGNIDLASGQGSLWPQYAFDVIPLEFISSIYETFVTQRASTEGIFYTPPHLVDFILDRVLPWNGTEWDLKVIDPACGSGIFLVKAFQRLIHRWKRHTPDKPIRAQDLRRLLERNIFGVDKDKHAVRVACFSLYLAMCDEIDPRHYWTQINFPPMRDIRLVCSDFFKEDRPGFRTAEDANSYDLAIGNAPWGEKLMTEAAKEWAAHEERKWPVANQGIGTLFLPKAAALINAKGRVAIIQSASSLLFNRQGKAIAFRKRLFETHRVEEVVNLSALRFRVFKRKTHATKKSISPACVVILGPGTSSPDDVVSYVSPKQAESLVDEFQIIVEPKDERRLTVRDAASDVYAWSALMWGSNRDRALLRRLQTFPSMAKPGEGHTLNKREGIIFGDRKKPQPQLKDRKIFDAKQFPSDLLYLETHNLPRLARVETDSRASTDFSAFAVPQLIIKQGWQREVSRFQARLVKSARHGILCTQSYITVHDANPNAEALEAACLSLNSMIATYFLFLTSGRFASYRPEPLVEELLAVPIPVPRSGLLNDITSQLDLDKRAMEAFGLKDAERTLIEDIFTYTLPDFQGDSSSLGRRQTQRLVNTAIDPQLTAYCEYFSRVLRAGFGRNKAVRATIFREPAQQPMLPYRLVAFELGEGESIVRHAEMRSSELMVELYRMAEKSQGNIFTRRAARVYEAPDNKPTVFIIKPDMQCYWTRSSALNDGDEVAADLFDWMQASFHTEVA